MQPSFEEFQKQMQGFQTAVLYERRPLGEWDAAGLFEALFAASGGFLLEADASDPKARVYSYLGGAGAREWRGEEGALQIREGACYRREEGEPLSLMQAYLSKCQAGAPLHLPPFTGGVVGWIGYDNVSAKKGGTFQQSLDLPTLHLLEAQEILAIDHQTQTLYVIVHSDHSLDLAEAYREASRRLRALTQKIDALPVFLGPGPKKAPPSLQALSYQSSESKESFMAKVSAVQDSILAGEVKQVVLSQRLQVGVAASAWEIYRQLRQDPAPYRFYIDFGEYQVGGASPENLLALRGRTALTRPIAGTRSRGQSQEQDAALDRELRADPKEQDEHAMLVGLARQDLQSISCAGSVKRIEDQQVHRFSHVMHLVSTLQATLKPEIEPLQALRACLPAGTVSGTERARAMQIIRQMEPLPREFYGGALGYAGFNQNLEMCLSIRSFVYKDKQVYLQAGAGIVAQSVPETEYQETLKKLSPLLECIGALAESDCKGVDHASLRD